MKIREYQARKSLQLKREAVKFYKQGYTLRKVAQMVGRSHEWVRQAYYELSIDRGLTKNDEALN